MGLDLSLEGTGLVILDGKGGLVDSQTLVSTPKEGDLIMRCGRIWGLIQPEMETHEPKTVVIEDVFFGQRTPKFDPRKGRHVVPKAGRGDRAAKPLWSLSAIVRFMLMWEFDITARMVPASTLKRFVAGHGSATKETMINAVRLRWKVDFGKQHNEADAYGLARMGLEGAA